MIAIRRAADDFHALLLSQAVEANGGQLVSVVYVPDICAILGSLRSTKPLVEAVWREMDRDALNWHVFFRADSKEALDRIDDEYARLASNGG